MIFCPIDQLLPTDGLLEEFAEHQLTQSILKELKDGGRIRRALEVSLLSDHSGHESLSASYRRLGFSVDGPRYIIHLGHHRWAAAKLAGVTELAVEVVPPANGTAFIVNELVLRSLGPK